MQVYVAIIVLDDVQTVHKVLSKTIQKRDFSYMKAPALVNHKIAKLQKLKGYKYRDAPVQDFTDASILAN